MRLHINIDHVATVRQARGTDEPQPVVAAILAELGGADGITVHLREDRRHIQDHDVHLLMDVVRTGVNLELAAEPDMVAIGCEIVPMAATLVPERRQEITTEGGLALHEAPTRERVAAAVERLRAAGIRTALFVDPDPRVLEIAGRLGVDAVELHTGGWAHAWKGGHVPDAARARQELDALRDAASAARSLGLAVHAGHGLTYENVSRVAAIEAIEELNIGHSVVSRAIAVGMERAVADMKAVILRARAGAAAS